MASALENNTSVKGVEYAREAVALHAGNRHEKARKAMAAHAVRIGNYTVEARAVWQSYIDAGCPKGYQA